LRVPRTATLTARNGSGREDHRSAPKPALKPVQVVARRGTGPVHLNGITPRIRPSDEPIIQRAITLVQGKWRIAILCQLQDGPLRVGELKRRMRPISKKVLNQHLRRMERDGLVVRTELKSKIPHVEYALTSLLGCSVIRLLQTILQSDVQNAPGAIPGGCTHP
jgi:DNA-binding HxlR family transcriptional regulator